MTLPVLAAGSCMLGLSGTIALTGGIMLLRMGADMLRSLPGLSLDPQQQGKSAGQTFYSFHILADPAWYALIAFAVSRGRNLLADRPYRLIIGFCTLFLFAYGGYFEFHGIVKLTTL